MANWKAIAGALQGFGAGVQGNGPQYLQGIQQQKYFDEQMQRQRQEQRSQDNEQVKRKMAQEFMVAYQNLSSGNPAMAAEALRNIANTPLIGSSPAGKIAASALNDLSMNAAPVAAKKLESVVMDVRARYPDLLGKPYEPKSDIGRLTSDYRQGLMSEPDYVAAIGKLNAQPTTEGRDPQKSMLDALEIERRIRELSEVPPTPEQISAERVQEDAEGQNLDMLNALSDGAESRQLNIERAKKFLQKFEDGEVSSGTSVRVRDWVPGTWTKQGRFNEQFNAFAEVAARQQLKANGETRPTDADVEGMKRAMFGVGRTPETNIELLKEYIATVEADESLYQQLLRARRSGQLGSFIPDVRARVPAATGASTSSAPSTGGGRLIYNPTTGRLE